MTTFEASNEEALEIRDGNILLVINGKVTTHKGHYLIEMGVA